MMNAMSKEIVRCPQCGELNWSRTTSIWICANGHRLKSYNGLPDFTIKASISQRDKMLQDDLYEGLLGRYYSFIMPLLALPARPAVQSIPQWTVFLLAWLVMAGVISVWISTLANGWFLSSWVCVIMMAIIAIFLAKYRYFFWLLMLAIPVKVSLLLNRFKPEEDFNSIHQRLVGNASSRGCETVLDVSTGTCNSLLRHGWEKLSAKFYGVDLSAIMLLQGANNAADVGVAVDLYIADAQSLPFLDGSMDLVLNYGALNGYEDQQKALQEISRILKPGGMFICLDEQLYDKATEIEALYFDKVLSAHNKIKNFPNLSVPDDMILEELHQVYQFYYLAVLRKK